jgi:hypothetical protein
MPANRSIRAAESPPPRALAPASHIDVVLERHASALIAFQSRLDTVANYVGTLEAQNAVLRDRCDALALHLGPLTELARPLLTARLAAVTAVREHRAAELERELLPRRPGSSEPTADDPISPRLAPPAQEALILPAKPHEPPSGALRYPPAPQTRACVSLGPGKSILKVPTPVRTRLT